MNDKRKLALIIAVLLVTIAVSFAVYSVYRDKVDPMTGEISNASYLLRKVAIEPNPDAEADQNQTMAAVSSQAPDFTMQDAQGNQVTLSSLKGKPVVLNFWTSWCSYCKTEMPYFESAYKQYGDKVQFVMLNPVKSERSSDDGRNYIKNSGYTFPVFYETDGKALSLYGLRGFPATIFIDADGKITAKTIGAITQDKLNQSIGSLIK